MTDNRGQKQGKSKWILLSALGIAFAFITTAAVGRPGGHGGPEFMLWKIDRMLGKVDASEEQRAAVEEITSRAVGDMKAMREQKQGIHEDFVAVLTAESIDREALEALRVEVSEAKERASIRMTEAIADIAEVLTREQRLTIAEHAAERFERRRHW